ncbi:hypothetical protein BH10PSE2_BH10PSE2_30570 [soil metagenome]
MTDPFSAATTTPPALVSLAEGRWLWRRIYVFIASFGLWALLASVVRQATPQTLPHVADGLVCLLALLLVLYLVAPTAQQIVELLANLRLRLRLGEQA